MDQFRQVGEVLGGLQALMVLNHEIPINQRQCRLLYDMLDLAFYTISEEIKQNLKLKDRNTKWVALELPMKELHKVFKDADLYIRLCMDTTKDWWGKAISLHMNRDCVELHVHNLLCCFPAVIEAIEMAAEISGIDQDDMQKRRTAIMQKYDPECDDPKIFLWKFGRQYLVPREICARLETAWTEDRWLLLTKAGKKKQTAVAKLLTRKLNNDLNSKLLPSSVLVGGSDYYVRRRLGSGGGHLKEIHWLGENFALRTFNGDISLLQSDIDLVLSLSHPNVLQYLCAFYDEDKKEGFLVMELMSKDLGSYIKEQSGQKNKLPFTIPVAVDIMLQIARGMEYLHSKNIYLGDLNSSNILLKAKNSSNIGRFQVRVTGFGMTSVEKPVPSKSAKSTVPPANHNIWLAPEVLAELEQPKSKPATKHTEKADVYSFGMLCFELLTGKVPFEDSHLQGEKMVRNIRAGERPLFSYPSPKYLQNLTRKCWQTSPDQRPTFSSICRILRYIKKNLAINPNHGDPESPPPLVDYYDMEAGYLKKFPAGGNGVVSQIPFQMFTYTIFEKEKVCGRNEGSTYRRMSVFDDEQMAGMDDFFLVPTGRRSFCSDIINNTNSAIAVDMRSVISEIPHRKLHQFDQRSIGSESSGKKFFGGVADQRAFGSLTPEKKNKKMTTDKKSPIIVPEVENKTTDQHVISQPTVSVKPQEQVKPTLTKTTEQKSENKEILDVKQSLRSIVDHKQTSSSEPSEGKPLSRVSSFPLLPEIPEKKILQGNGELNQKNASTPSTISEKKAEPTAKSTKKPDDSDNSVKKPDNPDISMKKHTLFRKLKDLTTKRNPESSKTNPAKPEPAKIKKTKPIFSPAASPSRAFSSSPSRAFISSPSRTFKKSSYSEPLNAEPPRSPARTKKTVPDSNPASSPSRVFQTCPSPLHPSAHHHSKECTSPPLHHCSRLGRQTSLTMSSRDVK